MRMEHESDLWFHTAITVILAGATLALVLVGRGGDAAFVGVFAAAVFLSVLRDSVGWFRGNIWVTNGILFLGGAIVLALAGQTFVALFIAAGGLISMGLFLKAKVGRRSPGPR